MEKIMKPTNGKVEPDFLHYLVQKFKKWQQLKEDKVTLGIREIAALKNVVEGARLNSRYGFSFKLARLERDGEPMIVLQIFTGQEQEKERKPEYFFEAEIY